MIDQPEEIASDHEDPLDEPAAIEDEEDESAPEGAEAQEAAGVPTIKPRSAWNAQSPKRTTQWNLENLLGPCIHWWGTPRSPARRDLVPATIRGVQRTHMGPGGLGVADGGSDIAYNFIVDNWGDIWEGRGWNAQTGANGTSDANRSHLAVACAIGVGDTPTPAMLNSLASLVNEAFRRGVGHDVAPHQRFTGSTCPGPDLLAWVSRKGWEDAVRDVRFELLSAGRVIDKSSSVPMGGEEEKERALTFLGRVRDRQATLLVRGKPAEVRRVPD